MHGKSRYRRMTAVLLTVFLLFGTAACGARGPTLYQTTFLDVFDTATTVKLYADSEEQFRQYADAVREQLLSYHRLYDIYRSYDGLVNLKTVNEQAGQREVAVDDRILELLTYGKTLYTQTDGRVNIACGRLLGLWHACREQAAAGQSVTLPDGEALREAMAHADPEQVILDRERGTVRFADPQLQLDVGAIAKGYAVEQVCRFLREQGLSGAVNAGGNVRVIGTKPDGSLWKIGIEDPTQPEQYAGVAEVSDGAVVTSGDYQRYFEQDGVRYAHIIDPQIGYPPRYMRSVTVVTSDSAWADGLSTGLFLMTVEEGLAFVEQRQGVEALWILEDGSQVRSSGMPCQAAGVLQ